MSGEHLEENASEAVDIASSVDLFARRLLRTHVGSSAYGDACSRELLVSYSLDGSSNSEIGDNGVPMREQNVARLDVAMDEALGVCVSECVSDFARNIECLANRKRTFLLDLLLESWSLDVWHDVIRQAIDFTGVEHREDVWMLKACRDVDFSGEALATDYACEVSRENLQSNPASVAHVAREIDGRHASAAELALDRVAVIDDSG